MVGHGEKFGRKKEDAIAALLSQRSVEDAARVAGIGTNTLLRWLQMPEFQAAYRQARREAFGQATARLQQASGAAVSTLLKVMVDQSTPANQSARRRLRAGSCRQGDRDRGHRSARGGTGTGCGDIEAGARSESMTG